MALRCSRAQGTPLAAATCPALAFWKLTGLCALVGGSCRAAWWQRGVLLFWWLMLLDCLLDLATYLCICEAADPALPLTLPTLVWGPEAWPGC